MAELTLDMLKNQTEEEILLNQTDGIILYELSKLSANLLLWFPFSSGARVLEIGAGCGTITGMLCEKGLFVTAVEKNCEYRKINTFRNQNYVENQLNIYEDVQQIDTTQKYDYILFRKEVSEKNIAWAKTHLIDQGTLMIAIDNRYGLSRFVATPSAIQTKDCNSAVRPQLCHWLKASGFNNPVFYYPFPDYRLPVEIYSDDCWPGPGALREDFVDYMEEQTGFLDEPALFDQICEDGMYQQFANSFLVIAGSTPQMIYAKFTSLRKPEFRTWVQILDDGNEKSVLKGMLTDSTHLDKMLVNYQVLSDLYQNVRPVPMTKNKQQGKKSFSIPFVHGQALLEECDFVQISTEELEQKIKNALPIILDMKPENSCTFEMTPEFSQIFYGCNPGAVKAYKIANMDSIFSNFICQGQNICCIDYEWVFSFPVPVEYIVYRAILYLYKDHKAAFVQRQMELCELMQMADITEEAKILYDKMERCFQEYVHGENLKYIYTQRYKKNRYMVQQLPKLIGDKENHIHNLEQIIAAQKANLEEVKHAISNPFYGIRLLLRKKRK